MTVLTDVDDLFDLFGEDRPALSLRLSDVTVGLQGIAKALAYGDQEMASSLQERMHFAVLAAVAQGHRHGADLARAARASRLLFQAHNDVRSACWAVTNAPSTWQCPACDTFNADTTCTVCDAKRPSSVPSADAPAAEAAPAPSASQIRAAAFREAAKIADGPRGFWWDADTQVEIGKRLRAAADEAAFE